MDVWILMIVVATSTFNVPFELKEPIAAFRLWSQCEQWADRFESLLSPEEIARNVHYRCKKVPLP